MERILEARSKRHLAAIFAADVAGYSRLMGADEEGTLTQLRDHRSKVWDPALTQHRGRVANTAGDSILAEFRCHRRRHLRFDCSERDVRTKLGRDAGPAHRIFQIGINLGEVLTDGRDILAMASMSRRAWRAWRIGVEYAFHDRCWIRSKASFDLSYRELGRQNLKNISNRWRLCDPPRRGCYAGLQDAGVSKSQTGD